MKKELSYIIDSLARSFSNLTQFLQHIKNDERLSPEESEKLQRVARVFAMAKDVWGSVEDAREFMVKRHPMLDDRSPFEASLSEIGAREVESILGRLLFGSAA